MKSKKKITIDNNNNKYKWDIFIIIEKMKK
jgi:hypothetical protein